MKVSVLVSTCLVFMYTVNLSHVDPSAECDCMCSRKLNTLVLDHDRVRILPLTYRPHCKEWCPESNLHRIALRGGSDDMKEENIIDQWDMTTGPDMFNVNVTYLQLRSHPFTIVELWWDSGGRFRFTYEATGMDVMGAWPHGSTSNISAWEVESLVEDIIKARGTLSIPARYLELGRWRLDVAERFINITNIEQSENELLLTDFGFVFFDCFGRALINRGMHKRTASEKIFR